MTLDRLPYEEYEATNCEMCGFPVGSPECMDAHFEMEKMCETPEEIKNPPVIALPANTEYVLTVCPHDGSIYFQYIEADSDEKAKRMSRQTMEEKSPEGICSWRLAKIEKFIL